MGKDDNELMALEMIHQYVEILDRYFGNVCELDIIFNFHKVCYQVHHVWIVGATFAQAGSYWERVQMSYHVYRWR